MLLPLQLKLMQIIIICRCFDEQDSRTRILMDSNCASLDDIYIQCGTVERQINKCLVHIVLSF